MEKLWVYADFDWLKEIELVGELSYEVLRGSGTLVVLQMLCPIDGGVCC